MQYFQLKDKKSSQGARIAGVFFNNATVVAFEDDKVPTSIGSAVRSGILAKATKAEYDKREKELKAAAENAQKMKEKRQAESDKRLANAMGVEVEEVVTKKKRAPKKTTAKKPTTKKATVKETQKEETPKED